MSAELVTFPGPSLVDVVGLLRRCADDIEAGAYGAVRRMVAVLVDGDGTLHVFGWGELNVPEAVGLLTIGATNVTVAGFPTEDPSGSSAA